MRADGVKPRNSLRREHVRKIAHIVGGLGRIGDRLGSAGIARKAKRTASNGGNRANRARRRPFISSPLYVGRAAEVPGGQVLHWREMSRTITESTLPAPPIARKHHTETQMHGVVLADDYAWLRDKENPEVTAYLEAENAYADAVMAPLAGLREELYQEMLSHVKQTDISVPYRDGAWWYYTRTEEGLQYGIYCRKRGGPAGPDADAAEEVVLDGNELAKGHAFFSIGDTDITRRRPLAGLLLPTPRAFASTRCTSRTLKPARRWRARWSAWVLWSGRRTTERLFYTVEDEQQKRQYQVWRHALGAAIRGRRAGLSGRRRTLQHCRRADARRQVHRCGVGQPHDQRGAGSAGGRAGRRVPLDCAARGRARVLGRPPQRAVVHPDQRSRAEFSAGDSARGNTGPRTLDRADCASRRRDARGRGSLRRIFHRLRTRGWTAAAAAMEVCEATARMLRRAGEIAFPEPAYSAHPHINRIFETTTFRYALSIAGDAELGVRVRRGDWRIDTAQAA